MTKMPWDYIEPTPGAPQVINHPTPEGRELGFHLARFARQEEHRLRAAGVLHMPPRCHDCAFRRGTVPNQCPSTLMNAIKCVAEEEPFHCHIGVKEGDEPKALCRGWLLMRREADPPGPPILLPPVGGKDAE